jgi:hypothetical protein
MLQTLIISSSSYPLFAIGNWEYNPGRFSKNLSGLIVKTATSPAPFRFGPGLCCFRNGRGRGRRRALRKRIDFGPYLHG